MTRKSKREIERAIENFDEPTVVGYMDMLRYLHTHVAERGADAELPAEYFGDHATWGPWAERIRDFESDSYAGIAVDVLTPPERFGLRYCGDEVVRGIVAMRTRDTET